MRKNANGRSREGAPVFVVVARGVAAARPLPHYAEKLEPQPQPPVAFGFLNVKPEPCIEVT